MLFKAVLTWTTQVCIGEQMTKIRECARSVKCVSCGAECYEEMSEDSCVVVWTASESASSLNLFTFD